MLDARVGTARHPYRVRWHHAYMATSDVSIFEARRVRHPGLVSDLRFLT